MPLDHPMPLLEAWRVRATGSPNGVAVRGARMLAWLGASAVEEPGVGEVLDLSGPAGNVRVTVAGWEGEQAARERCGLAAIERAAGDPAEGGPGGMVVAQYLGALAAAAALRAARSSRAAMGWGRAPRPDAALRIAATPLARGVVEGLDKAAVPAASLLRCLDGWLVARWRHPDERRLLAAALSASGLDVCVTDSSDLRGVGVDDAWAAARACRLLVAPVRPAREQPARAPAGAPTVERPGDLRRSGGQMRIVDWAPLWAGPWATGALADQGHQVTRIEPPGRRDGLLRTTHGRACWHRWNGAKSLALLDARGPAGQHTIRELLIGSHVLVTGLTPRVLPQLGLDDDWFACNAPRLLCVELVGFDEPNQDLPAVGEQAAAVAGLLSATDLDSPPFPPLPWPDPLLGANCLLAIRAWDAAGRPPGIRIRLSLEGAARLALAA